MSNSSPLVAPATCLLGRAIGPRHALNRHEMRASSRASVTVPANQVRQLTAAPCQPPSGQLAPASRRLPAVHRTAACCQRRAHCAPRDRSPLRHVVAPRQALILDMTAPAAAFTMLRDAAVAHMALVSGSQVDRAMPLALPERLCNLITHLLRCGRISRRQVDAGIAGQGWTLRIVCATCTSHRRENVDSRASSSKRPPPGSFTERIGR